MKEIVAKIALPKRYAVLPVLIHCNEVSDEVIQSEYFYKIINIADYLQS